ncbi:MAG: ATP-binding cassette domain-containing protein, partial [Christensenellaceae bacterium]
GFGGKYIKYLSLRMQDTLTNARLSDIHIKPDTIKHILYYDILSVYSVIAVQLPMAVKSLIVTIVAILIGFFFGALYASVILIAFIIGLLLSLASRKMISSASRRTNIKMKAQSSVSSEFVDNLSLSQMNSLGRYYADKTASSIDEFIFTAKREDLKTYFWYGIVENYNQLFSIILSALLALPFAGGSIVNLVFFTMLADIIMTQGMNVQNSLLGIMKTRVCFENVEGILNLKGRKNCLHIKNIHCIEMQDITFAYRSDRYVFQNFSCKLERGDAVRISGANGSGKSTFAKLICGLYTPQAGRIIFNNSPLCDIAQDDINRSILYISQEEPLLNEKVSVYLSLIADRALQEGEFISLCNQTGFKEGDVPILEEGKNLSPGQRKKIMMMKYLLLKDRASVIIIDEAFAGLDGSGRETFSQILNYDIAINNKIYIIIEHTDVGINTSKTIHI